MSRVDQLRPVVDPISGGPVGSDGSGTHRVFTGPQGETFFVGPLWHRGWVFFEDFWPFFLRCLNICWVYIRCLQSKTKTRGILLFKQITVVKSLPNVQLSALFISSRNPFCFLSQQTPGISPRKFVTSPERPCEDHQQTGS